MTREAFMKVLDSRGYSYSEPIGGNITLRGKGDIILNSILSLPSGIIFMNTGKVELDSLKSIPPGVVFDNGWFTSLNSLKSIPPGVVFDNRGDIYLNSLVKGNCFINAWKGNIEGINYKRLINKMIALGLFDR
jgi:hypothetical protein